MTRRSGFTLIELVVVIMILGILAGVAAPKLFNTSATATDNGLKQTLAIIRDAIELYAGKYGNLPPCTEADASDFHAALAEFMRGSTFPKAPVGPNKDDQVSTATGAGILEADATPTKGWRYHTGNGQFIINFAGASANSGPPYDTF